MSDDVYQNACIPGPLDGEAMLLEGVLSVENVCKEFPMNDGSTLVVLKDFTLSIRDIKDKPQIVSLLGPSGAGKTTALRIIAGLDKPTKGKVLVSKSKGSEMCPATIGDVGVVFQRYPLFEDLTVFDNLSTTGGAE